MNSILTSEGFSCGAFYTVTDQGTLTDYASCPLNRFSEGVEITWDDDGNLASEAVLALD